MASDMGSNRAWRGLCVGVALLLMAPQAFAADDLDATPLGTDRRISTVKATAGEYEPVVAWNATTNQYLVVWTDERNLATRDTEIYGRRVGADGVGVGPDIRISTSVYRETNPAVVWNATANEYLVVWEDNRGGTIRGDEIYGRRVGADGVPIGSDFRVSNSTSSEDNPAIVWNATVNRYLVVWQDDRAGGTHGWDIWGRRLGPTGAAVGAEFRISSSPANEEVPAVVWNATANQYLVVWKDTRSSGTRGEEIYGRRLGSGGALLGSELRVSGSVSDERDPAVAWSPTANQYLVVWTDYRSSPTRGSEIYGRRVGAAGGLPGSDTRLSNSTLGELWPAVVWNATANQYLVVWADERVFGSYTYTVFGRRVAATGALIGGNVRISNTGSDDGEYAPQVAWNQTANHYLVVWSDERGSNTDIYGRRVTGDAAVP